MTKDAIATTHSEAEATNPEADAALETTASAPLADVQAMSPKATRRRVHAQNPQRAPDAAGIRSSASGRAEGSKTELVLKKLRLARGATIAQIMEAAGWQAHSVRGFLSAVVRKKLDLDLTSEMGKDGQRRYRIDAGSSGVA
jgi:hypothetical protein